MSGDLACRVALRQLVVEFLELGKGPLGRCAGFRSARRTKRPVRNGSVPPEWEKIQRMSGNLVAVPLKTRWAIVRVEFVAYSIDPGGFRAPGRGGNRAWSGGHRSRPCGG